MRYLHLRRPSRPTIFAMLMAASLVMFLLPDRLLRSARSVAQSLAAPPQLIAHRATQRTTSAIGQLAQRPVAAERHAQLLRQKQSLENENIALRDRLARHESTIAELAGLREVGLGSSVTLIPAGVIAMSASTGRDSIVVGKGSVHDVSDGDWVVTGLEIGAGTADGVEDACAVLARQCLIGWVEHAGPFTSQVLLLSDRQPTRPLRVHLARGDGQHELLTAETGQPLSFVLEGAGEGRMLIRDIPKALVSGEHVREGDIVASDPRHARLPVMTVIGRIEELELNRSNPIFYNAVVGHACDLKSLTRVIIANLDRTSDQTSQ